MSKAGELDAYGFTWNAIFSILHAEDNLYIGLVRYKEIISQYYVMPLRRSVCVAQFNPAIP
ncbi:MAG: hypothetical protein ACK5B6_11875 [Bacteroidia bacterium]